MGSGGGGEGGGEGDEGVFAGYEGVSEFWDRE